MEDAGDLEREVSEVVRQCREVESDWLRAVNAPATAVPEEVAQAILLGRILSRADADLARLIIGALHSSRKAAGSAARDGFSLDREIATFSAQFEWKQMVSDLKAAGADFEEVFWAGYQFHADLLEKLGSIGESPQDDV